MRRDKPRLMYLCDTPQKTCIEYAIQIANSEGYEAAIPLFKKLVDIGESVSNCYLGMIYEFGMSESESKHQFARFYYKQAIEDGWVPGLIGLGRIYYYGLGVRQDLPKAFEYFCQIDCAGLSSPIADYYIGQMYQLGEGVEKDVSKAKYYFRRSLSGGYQYSRFRLSMIAKQEGKYSQWVLTRMSLLVNTLYCALRYGTNSWHICLPTSTMGPTSNTYNLIKKERSD